MRDLAHIGCRVLSLFFLYRAIEAVSVAVTASVMWFSNNDSAPSPTAAFAAVGLVQLIVLLGAAGVLWFGSASISRLVVPSSASSGISNFDPDTVAAIVFRALGVSFFVLGARDLAFHIHYRWALRTEGFEPQQVLQTTSDQFASGVEVALGLALILGGARLAGRLRRTER